MLDFDVMFKSDGFSQMLAISFDNKTLVTPTYFPAISSFGIKHGIRRLIELVVRQRFPRLLISAYDLHKMKKEVREGIITKELQGYVDDSFLFLDSGMFESYWLRDSKWTMESYKQIAKKFPFDIFTSLDFFPMVDDVSSGIVSSAIRRIKESRGISNSPGFAPIIHGVNPKALVAMVESIMKKIPNDWSIIAVPERDCGRTILEKANTIARIRRTINENRENTILHILGCGNPKSLALFSFCGADSFDSLDWIKYAINPISHSLDDFSYLDYLSCDCRVCTGSERQYEEKVFLHNLTYYQELIKSIQTSIRKDQISEFIEERLGSEIALIAERALRESK